MTYFKVISVEYNLFLCFQHRRLSSYGREEVRNGSDLQGSLAILANSIIIPASTPNIYLSTNRHQGSGTRRAPGPRRQILTLHWITGSNGHQGSGTNGHQSSGSKRAPGPRRQILARIGPQAAMGTKARAPGEHLSHGGKSWHPLDHRQQWAPMLGHQWAPGIGHQAGT